MLLSQSEARRNPLVDAEQTPEEFRAIAFLAAVQQHDMVRQSTSTIEEFPNGG